MDTYDQIHRQKDTGLKQSLAHVGLNGKHGSEANHASAAIQHLCIRVEGAESLTLGVEEGGDE